MCTLSGASPLNRANRHLLVIPTWGKVAPRIVLMWSVEGAAFHTDFVRNRANSVPTSCWYLYIYISCNSNGILLYCRTSFENTRYVNDIFSLLNPISSYVLINEVNKTMTIAWQGGPKGQSISRASHGSPGGAR